VALPADGVYSAVERRIVVYESSRSGSGIITVSAARTQLNADGQISCHLRRVIRLPVGKSAPALALESRPPWVAVLFQTFYCRPACRRGSPLWSRYWPSDSQLQYALFDISPE
jgi:hypothetical protein